MREKYPFTSSYVYCNANPVKYVDPDGRKVAFRKGTSWSFKINVIKAINYLKQNGAGEIIEELMKSEKTYYIVEGIDDTYKASERTIYWNPYSGLETTEGTKLSPANGLNHELDHALQHDQNPKQYKKDSKTHVDFYGNKEELRVIEGSERETAIKLGEITEDQETRNDHRGTPYQTTGPTTTEEAK